MARKMTLVLALAFLLTCGPTAVTPAPSDSPTATLTPIASTDLITLREGGQQPSLAVRKVANAALVTSLPDGLLLPDGKTLLSVEAGASQTKVTKLTRLKGAPVASMEIPGTWQLYRGFPSFTGASADGSHVLLMGGSYRFTDATGTWTSKTTFGVLDLASWRVVPVELEGQYGYEAMSNDGQILYLAEYTSTSTRSRAYDLKTRGLGDVIGDATFSPMTYAAGFAFGMVTTNETVTVRPDVIQVTSVTKLARLDLMSRNVVTLPLPVDKTPQGEDSLAWSLVVGRDEKTLYAINPMIGALHEIDIPTFQIRRSAPMNDTVNRGLLDGVLAFVHPTADAKMGFGTGAVLSPDGASIYVLAAQGVWKVDRGALKAKVLTHDGAYETVAVSPDGARLYVLGRMDGVISAIDAQSGKVIGSMRGPAFPSDIVAIDAG